MASLRSDESLQNGGLQVRLKERDEGLQGFEAVPVNSQLPDLGLECLPGNAQSSSSTGWPRNQSTSLRRAFSIISLSRSTRLATRGTAATSDFEKITTQNPCPHPRI